MKKNRSQSFPEKMRPLYEAIIGITDELCQNHLNQEYAELCRRMAAALSRKRPSPLLQGSPKTWACAIVYAMGKVNFLFDKTQKPHMRADQLCSLMGASQSTASAKANTILNSMKIMLLDPRWCLPSKLDANPMAWLIEVNGLVVDARWVPREIQEEAHRRGLIPYMPEETA